MDFKSESADNLHTNAVVLFVGNVNKANGPFLVLLCSGVNEGEWQLVPVVKIAVVLQSFTGLEQQFPLFFCQVSTASFVKAKHFSCLCVIFKWTTIIHYFHNRPLDL